MSVLSNCCSGSVFLNLVYRHSEYKIYEQDSQSLAAAIALRKAIQKYGLGHAISFHKSIKRAVDSQLDYNNEDYILSNSSPSFTT